MYATTGNFTYPILFVSPAGLYCLLVAIALKNTNGFALKE